MSSDREKKNRKPTRLKDFDYSNAGAYFVTIVTQGHICLFGEVVEEEMVVNDAGKMIENWWLKLSEKYDHIELDEFIVMPNHVHGIINIIEREDVGADLRVRPGDAGEIIPPESTHVCSPMSGANFDEKIPLYQMIQWVKTMTTNEYIRQVKYAGWKPFPGKLWQRSFYDHIIRDEEDLDKIREYIHFNGIKWALDEYHPRGK